MNTKSRRLVLALLALVAGVAATLWAVASGQSTQSPPPKTEPVTAASVDSNRQSLRYPEAAPQLAMIRSQTLSASPLPIADVLSARIVYDEDVTARVGVGLSGRIVALRVAAGDAVKTGQVLAEIDSPDYGTALADLDKARADEGRKLLVNERAQDLASGEGVAAKDLEIAQADYAQARAETTRAQQRLKNMNPHGLIVRGQRLGLTSPLAGVVTERSATPALEVGPGLAAPLFVVTDPRRLWLMIDMPERLLPRIKLGSNVSVESDAYPGERFNAKIVQLGQLVDPNTRRVVIRARLENPERKLLPEMFVRAVVLQDTGSGVQVPNSAIVNRGVYAFVFVQTAPGEFRRRQVTLLTHGSEAGFVGDGLSGGERVVTTGALLLDAELSARSGDKP